MGKLVGTLVAVAVVQVVAAVGTALAMHQLRKKGWL